MNDIELLRDIKKIMRFFKRIALGENSPSKYLRILCWINLGWSFLMIICLLFFVLLSATELKFQTKGLLSNFIHELNAFPFIIWACFHGVIALSIVFIWRQKMLGLIFYCIGSIAPPIYLYFLDVPISELYYMLITSVICIALFLFKLPELKNKEIADQD